MDTTYDLLCFSDVRWGDGTDRVHQLMLRAARDHRVFFIEEPLQARGHPRLEMTWRAEGLHSVVPLVPQLEDDAEVGAELARLIQVLLEVERVRRYVTWYSSPNVVSSTSWLEPLASVYDCTDEAPAVLRRIARQDPEREEELLSRSDLVFTSGRALYEAKRQRHPNVHAFPSSPDVLHFARARGVAQAPFDQAHIPHPQIGYYGTIDGRVDLDLVGKLATARPEWHVIMVGPVVGVDPAAILRRQNIHWLGAKPYEELPSYVATWDVAIVPFARNDRTSTMSSTRVAECLAAGKPVVSTAIPDVVRPWARHGLVHVASSWIELIGAIDDALREDGSSRTRAADPILAQSSWDRTWQAMQDLMTGVLGSRLDERVQSEDSLLQNLSELEAEVCLQAE